MLTRNEVESYHRDGFIGPYQLCSPLQMAKIRERIEHGVFTDKTPVSGHYSYARHLDSRLVYDMCSHSSIIDRLKVLYGPDLILWNSSFWQKEPATLPVPWHQDLHYWPVALNFSAWLAITSTTSSNGCLKVIPGSHLKICPAVEAPDSVLFEEMAEPACVDESRQLNIEMNAGEFILFSDRLLHGSAPNQSSEPRIGLVMRFTVPFVKLFQDRLPLFPEHKALVVSGKDRFGLNALGTPPPAQPDGHGLL